MRSTLTATVALPLIATVIAGCGDGGKTDEMVAKPETAGRLAAVAPKAPIPTMSSETHTFGKWRAVCDNGNDCVAYAGVDDFSAGWVRIAYKPGPASSPHVSVGFWPDADQVGVASVRIDDQTFTTQGTLTEGGFAVLSSPLQAARAIAQAKTLTAGVGTETIALTTQGAAAALLWIDERQGRLGGVNALVRIGDRPAAETPAPPQLPRVVAAAPVDQGSYGLGPVKLPASLQALPAVKACIAANVYNPALMEALQTARLSGDRELWIVPCGAGAYNLNSQSFLTGPNGADPVSVRYPGLKSSNPDADPNAAAELTNAEYDPETRTVNAFAKGRGIGDCGVASTWTWTGSTFVLTTESVMTDCQGMPSDLWPTTFRSR